MGTTDDDARSPDSTGAGFSSVGEEFTRARIACAMEQREAAKAMGISLMTLQALETGDYQRIGSPILVQGHLSRYAQLLDLPEQPILDRYERTLAAELAATTRDSKSRRRGKAAGWLKWLSYGLIPVALVGLSWLGLNRLSSNPEPAQESVSAIAEPAPEQTVAATPPPEPGPAEDEEKVVRDPVPAVSATGPSPPEPGPAEDEEKVVRDPVPAVSATGPSPVDTDAPPPSGQAPAMNGVPETADRDDAAEAIAPPTVTEPPNEGIAAESEAREPETPDSGIVAGAGPVTSAPTAEEAPEVEQQPPGESRLVLRFSQDCWLEIRDAEANRLAYGLSKGGTTTTVAGPAPFSLVLGYAPGVEIELDGNPVDRSVYVPARGAVSRFSLGKPAQSD